MNRERLLKIIEDMSEVLKNLNDCKDILKSTEDNKTIFVEFGLKQIFVDFFITVGSLTSMILKDLKEFKIGIDMKQALTILKNKNVIDTNIFCFLNEARLLRNRIFHRYKEPSREELLEFIEDNLNNFSRIVEIAKTYM